MANEYYNDEQNMAELVSRMPAEEREQYERYGHRTVESVFIDRLFIVYKPTGLNPDKSHREPNVLTMVKVVDLGVDARSGFWITLLDQQTGREMQVGHVPQKLWTYPIYVSLPPKLEVRYDCRLVDNRPWRTLALAMLVKTKNKSTWHSAGNTYMEVPNKFRSLYPNVSGQQFRF